MNERPAPINTGTIRRRSWSTRPASNSASAKVRLPQTMMWPNRSLRRTRRLGAVAAEDLDLAIAPGCRLQRVRDDELGQAVDRLGDALLRRIRLWPVAGEHPVGGRAHEDRVDILQELELVGVVRVDVVDGLA